MIETMKESFISFMSKNSEILKRGKLNKSLPLMKSVTMSNPFLQNHLSVFFIFINCLKYRWKKSVKQNFLSTVLLRLHAAVAASSLHLSNYLISSLALSALFVFPSIFFFASPCNPWENFSSSHIHLSSFRQLIIPSSPVPWQCPHLCVSPSRAPVFILPSVGSSVSAFTHKQRLCHFLAGAFILRVAAIAGG